MGKILSGETEYTIGDSWADGEYLKLDTGEIVTAAAGGGGGGVITDTQANRPAAGTEGRLFLPSDGRYASYDNGSIWQATPIISNVCTMPSASSFTAVNDDAYSSLTDDGSSLILMDQGNGSSSVRFVAYLKELPSAPYSLTVGFEFLFFYPSDWSGIGLCLADGTNASSSKLTTLEKSHGPSYNYYQCSKASNCTAYIGNYYQAQNTNFPWVKDVIYLRIRDDNTNRYYEGSLDNYHWWAIASTTRTDYLTPTHGGLCVIQATNSLTAGVTRTLARIFYWSLG